MTPDEQRRAADRLNELLPLARREAAEHSFRSLESGSPLGEMQEPYLRIEYAVGVYIYPRFGGWYADILLDEDKLPPSVPTALGTPMKTPHKTREEAEENAIKLLALLIANSREPAPEKVEDKGKRYFSFFGIWLEIPAAADRFVAGLAERTGFDPADNPQYWLGRLDTLKQEAFGDGEVTGEGFDALPEMKRREIWTLCVIAWARLQLLRYPNDPEAPP